MGLFSKLFKSKKNVIKREGNPDVYNYSSEDERMNWAMEKAKLTLHYFEKCVENPKQGQQYFSLKARIEDGNKTEHIWLLEPEFDNQNNIYGIVGNAPLEVGNVSMHEKIGITYNDVSDWMIIENGRLIGGYTIRAIRDGFTGDELQNFDNSLGGMLIDDGEDYFMENLKTPEGAILSLEQAYNDNNLDKAINCKDFYKEAEFMLNKATEIKVDEELINKTAEVLKLSFIKNINENGMPKFNDIKRAFRRQFISENHCLVTEICYYPDGEKSIQKLNTYKVGDEWKVLSIEE